MAEDDDDTDEVIERFLELVLVTPPPMPSPGHQRAMRAAPEGPVSVERRAEDALRDLIDLGASADDLSALARGIRALALADALETLADGDTGPSNEFLYAYRELMAP